MATNYKERLARAIQEAASRRRTVLEKSFAEMVGDRREFGNGSYVVREPVTDEDGVITGYNFRITLSEYDELLERAEIHQEALTVLFQDAKSIGQAILAGLWKFYTEELCQFVGEYNPTDFAQWAQDRYAQHSNRKYIAQLASVITNVFDPIDKAYRAGTPYVLPSDGRTITVDVLIETYGLVERLISIQSAFLSLDREGQEQLLDMVLNATNADEVDATKNELTGKGKISVKIPFREVERPDGMFDLYAMGLTYEQLKLAKTLWGKAADQQFSDY